MSYQTWTKEEESILKAKYAQFGSVVVKDLLPHRSKASIRAKAYELGIVGPWCNHAKKKAVSNKEYRKVSNIINDFN